MRFLPDHKIVISPHQVSCKVGDDVVVLSLHENTYYGLKGIATFYWELIQQPITVSSIEKRLLAEYEVSADEASNDLQQFLEELHASRLIEVSEGHND